MAYFVGIDGGGSKTTCLLADGENILASATAGGSNIVRLGESEARSALRECVRAVCREAGVKPAQITTIYAGIAGAEREEVHKQLLAILAKIAPVPTEVVGDMVIAHHAALDGSPGIVVLSGTGSIAYGRHATGRTARAGGWGHVISDEGSGHWIGLQAVAAVTNALDAGTYTKLSDRILQVWELHSFDELVYRASHCRSSDFALLLPTVLETAQAGDSYACDVLARAGAELAALARSVFRRLWKRGEEVEIALTGGVLENSRQVQDSFRREVSGSIERARIQVSTKRPAEGAVALARKLVAASV